MHEYHLNSIHLGTYACLRWSLDFFPIKFTGFSLYMTVDLLGTYVLDEFGCNLLTRNITLFLYILPFRFILFFFLFVHHDSWSHHPALKVDSPILAVEPLTDLHPLTTSVVHLLQVHVSDCNSSGLFGLMLLGCWNNAGIAERFS